MIQSNVALEKKKQHKILDSKTRDLQIQITVIQIKLFEQLGPSLAQACGVCATQVLLSLKQNGQNQRYSKILVNFILLYW